MNECFLTLSPQKTAGPRCHQCLRRTRATGNGERAKSAALRCDLDHSADRAFGASFPALVYLEQNWEGTMKVFLTVAMAAGFLLCVNTETWAAENCF
jgi:hypothetical protein